MPPAPVTKSVRLECPHHGRGRLATRQEDTYVDTWGCCTCYVLCTNPVHDGTDWVFWVDPATGLGKCDDEACKCDHGYSDNTEVLVDSTGMAYHMSGEPFVARDAKVGPYHVNVKGKHKILYRRRH